jgi:cardiolipin synthase
MSAQFTSGNCVRLLESGIEYFPALEQAIAEAREEIHLETYIFENDATGRRIAAALGVAAQRGSGYGYWSTDSGHPASMLHWAKN